MFIFINSCSYLKKTNCKIDDFINNSNHRNKIGLIKFNSKWKKEKPFYSDDDYVYYDFTVNSSFGLSTISIKYDLNCNLISEQYTYLLNDKILVDPDSDSIRAYVELIYDFNKEMWYSYSHDLIKVPDYYVETTLFERDIDYLHYIQKIPWSELPKVDTLMYPIRRGR
jgi:hypothetical protein